MEHLSVFAAIISEVVTSLVSKYEKVHPCGKCKTVEIFLQAFINKL